MRVRRISKFAACVAALAIAAAAAPSASATGYWNMPSTFCQCVGCGYGAGHHAPYVLGPITCHGYLNHKEVRLPCPPRPPYCWYGYADGGCSNGCQAPMFDPSAL
jgi:hypothetical protein